MNRRSFFKGGLSIFALARMAHALGDSQFFRGEVPQGSFLPFWESLTHISILSRNCESSDRRNRQCL